MIPALLTLLKDNKGGVAIVITALTVIVLLGGTGTITMPADKAVIELEKKVDERLHVILAQQTDFYTQQNEYHKTRGIRDTARDLQNVRWEKADILREINRVHSIPEYTGREPTRQELSYLEQLQAQYNLMVERENQLMNQLGAP